MSIKCVATDCGSSSTTTGIFFYKFPTDRESCQKWLKILNRTDLEVTSLDNHFVCSLHFHFNNTTDEYGSNDLKTEIYDKNSNIKTIKKDPENEYIDIENDYAKPEFEHNKKDLMNIMHNYTNLEHHKAYQNGGKRDFKSNNVEDDMIRILEEEGDRIVCIEGIGYVRLYFEPPDYLLDSDIEEEDVDDEDEDKDEEIYQCAHCEAQFEDFNFLKIHVHQHSLIDNTNISPSGKSRIFKEFKEAYSLNNINNNYSKRNCLFDNSFIPKTKNDTNLYNKSFKEEHQCNDCGQNFASNIGLRNHSAIHAGSRPFICPICDKRFALLPCLKNHFQSMHSDKKFECRMCGKSYMNEHYLKVHLRLHGDKKMYQCVTCHKPFVDQPALKLHMRTHTGERPYKCTVCGRAFTQQSHLKTHLRLHTGERPFHCDLCEKSFRQISNLIEHRRRHERNIRFKS